MSDCPGWVWGEWEVNANGMEFLWEAMKYSCCLITKSCLTPSDPMEWSMPGFPVLHYLPEFAQTHVHCVSDAIPPSHPVTPFSSCLQSFPASGSFPMSQLFTSGGQGIGVQHIQSWIIQSWFPLRLTDLISLLYKGFSRVFSSTTIQKHHLFFDTQSSLHI